LDFKKNLRIVEEVEAVARELDATPAQVAIAWLLAKATTLRPSRHQRVARLEENIAAEQIKLSSDQLDWLNNLPAPAGEHYNEAQMQMIDRS
jgi:aryl-alcohol dehydrogenase-like predicted oxidoreductase